MKRIYLVRHGEKLKTPGNPPLSKKGITQAQLTAKYLSGLGISKVIASPILRTQQTAEYIASFLGNQKETNDLLRERANWGDDPSQSLEDFLTMWAQASMNREWQPPVGDSSQNSGRRLEKLISDLLKTEDENIVLVTHGGSITDFLRNIFDNRELSEFFPDFESSLDKNIKECSITIVESHENDPKLKLVELAYTGHLREISPGF